MEYYSATKAKHWPPLQPGCALKVLCSVKEGHVLGNSIYRKSAEHSNLPGQKGDKAGDGGKKWGGGCWWRGKGGCLPMVGGQRKGSTVRLWWWSYNPKYTKTHRIIYFKTGAVPVLSYIKEYKFITWYWEYIMLTVLYIYINIYINISVSLTVYLYLYLYTDIYREEREKRY